MKKYPITEFLYINKSLKMRVLRNCICCIISFYHKIIILHIIFRIYFTKIDFRNCGDRFIKIERVIFQCDVLY